jgi:hypothetical protein
MKSSNLGLKTLTAKLPELLSFFRKYVGFIFAIGLVGIYAFLAWQISVLSNAEPSAGAATQVVTSHVVKVDPQVLSKIQQLQDNSVNVQTLFNNARSNPFQEN